MPSRCLRQLDAPLVLLSFDCRATVEGLPNVHSSSTVTRLCHIGWQLLYRGGKVRSIFISCQLKAIPLFLFRVLLTPT